MPEFLMMQVESEIDALIDLFRQERVKSYLEIGSKFGGSLWRVGSSLPDGARIVSVDVPGGPKDESLNRCISELVKRGYDARWVHGNSTHDKIVEVVRALGPYDAVMIDGDHTLEGVFKDWENYAPMGKLVAFHDIGWFRTPTWQGHRIDVPELWSYLRRHYRHVEFCLCVTGKNAGIGVLWQGEGGLPNAT